MEDFDAVLVAAQHGDEVAATNLFRAFHPMLLRYIRSQEWRVADDIAGEVWLAAASALPAFRGDEDHYRAWLFTVARRRIIDHRRRGLRRRTEAADPAVFEEASSKDDPATTAVDSIDAQAAVDLITRVLSDEQAEVLILRAVADLSALDVARLMDRTEVWVRVTQHRAMKRLSAHLESHMVETR